MYTKRIQRVVSALQSMDLEQMLVTDPVSIYYLTGIYVEPLERFLGFYINAEGRMVLFLNHLYNVPKDTQYEQAWFADTDPVEKVIEPFIAADKCLGVDKDLKARFLLPLLHDKAAAGFVNASYAVDITRAVKDAEEIKWMRLASEINDKAIARFKDLIHAGITEKEAAAQTQQIYRELGADDDAFPPIVSFGANAADPHHWPDDTVLKEGDCVLFDVGCKAHGYCSDMTRTFYYKYADEHERKIYGIVKEANEKAESIIRPGVRLCDIDAAARDLITEHGYGPQFTHRLGHFIGLSGHEYGDVSSACEREVKPGMIFSIEPGIYLEGDIGVRIEDLCLVTEDGHEILNHYPHEAIVLQA